LKPQQARIPSSRNKPLQEQLLPLSIVHNQQQLRQDLKKEMEIYKYNQNQASWTQKPLIPSSIVNPYQQNKRNCELRSGPSAITTQHQYTLRQKSFLDKPTENQTLLGLKSDTNANSSTPN